MPSNANEEFERQEARAELKAMAQRVSDIAAEMQLVSYKIDEQNKDIEKNTASIEDVSRKITAIELASAKPLWMSAGIASAALVIGWLLNAWDGIGKIFHK